MTDVLSWLSTLPEPLLYGALVLAAFAENIFPPLPADTVIALGAFVAARGSGTALGVWTATMLGNLGTACHGCCNASRRSFHPARPTA